MSNFTHTKYALLSTLSPINTLYSVVFILKLFIKYVVQIFRGLAYIHTAPGVCHRDVKPQNLLVR